MRALQLVAAAGFAIGGVIQPADARAQAVQIEQIEITEVGIYCADTIGRIPFEEHPGGFRNIVANIKLLKQTTEIPALLGTRFGFYYAIAGRPHGASLTLRTVTKYPSPGLHDPDQGKTFLTSGHSYTATIGGTGYQGYHLEYDWEIVPGVWTFEFWQQNRKVGEQRLTLVEPQPQDRRRLTCAPQISRLVPQR
ncbi:MAG TPA: DUF3859 domain-containing protein [Xanthobacteraceae bacterium]|nr:DUF3859 domain-containing protein [Xanthobacteraceae bacterium]